MGLVITLVDSRKLGGGRKGNVLTKIWRGGNDVCTRINWVRELIREFQYTHSSYGIKSKIGLKNHSVGISSDLEFEISFEEQSLPPKIIFLSYQFQLSIIYLRSSPTQDSPGADGTFGNTEKRKLEKPKLNFQYFASLQEISKKKEKSPTASQENFQH